VITEPSQGDPPSVLSPQSSVLISERSVHIVPVRVLLAAWAALLVLTVLTVAAARVDLGGLNLWTALGIATFKAALVALYFMHLRYDKPFNAVVFVGAIFFVMLFVGLALLDSSQYMPFIEEYQAKNPPTQP
jgi:cytochrome c oxidase subunit IV